ncbi:hypothetical protein [Chryseobacterium indologenes]|uniref:Uncharacterized protein n=1 Tax=Chryseobacterium indologenes TaxID=253 RepID=A0A0N0IW37_CHRID|nr:hypothetical protein [Chryseobacterium indologenes]KPE51004.1 hypothetical protein AOB46_12510 [Chryseobacterium indologenes]
MSNYIAMFQYSKDTFSVIHSPNLIPEINDTATVYHKTLLHKPNRTDNKLNIIEIIETREHKTDPASSITIVRCEAQAD